MTKSFLYHQQKAYLSEILQIQFAFGLFSKESKELADGLLGLLSFMEISGSRDFTFSCSTKGTLDLRLLRGPSCHLILLDCSTVIEISDKFGLKICLKSVSQESHRHDLLNHPPCLCCPFFCPMKPEIFAGSI